MVTISTKSFIVDTESEKRTSWPNGSMVHVKQTNSLYVLLNKKWNLLTSNSLFDNLEAHEFKNKETQYVYIYYGFANTDDWKIKRKTISTNVWKTAIGTGSYANAWSNRNNITYS